MRPEDIREFLQHKPFQPFRLTLTDGRTYEVRHPEMAMVGRSAVAIGLPASNDPSPIYDRLGDGFALAHHASRAERNAGDGVVRAGVSEETRWCGKCSIEMTYLKGMMPRLSASVRNELVSMRCLRDSRNCSTANYVTISC